MCGCTVIRRRNATVEGENNVSDIKTDVKQFEEPQAHELRILLALVLTKTGPITISAEDTMLLMISGLVPVYTNNHEQGTSTLRLEPRDGE